MFGTEVYAKIKPGIFSSISRRSVALLGVAALSLCGCASTHSNVSSNPQSSTNDVPPSVPITSGGFGTPQGVPAGRIEVVVDGYGPALISLTVDGKTQQVRANTLPWSTTVSNTAHSVVLMAQTQSTSANAHISCLVVPSNGATPSLDNGTGAYSKVSCATGRGA